MGNQSEKKILQYKQKVIGYYFYPTVVACILFLGINLYGGYLLELWGFIVVVGITAVQWFCYKQISKSLDLGLSLDSYSYYMDVLAFNGVIQLGSCVYDGFWMCYWLLPLLALGAGGRMIWGWLQKPQYAQETSDGKEKKKKEKESIDTVRLSAKQSMHDKATQTKNEQSHPTRTYFSNTQIVLIMTLLLLIYIVYLDIQAKLNSQQANIAFKAKKCGEDYELQRCNRNMPLQREYCNALEKCIHVDWELQRSIELSGIVGDVIESFFTRMSFRSYMFSVLPLLIIFTIFIRG